MRGATSAPTGRVLDVLELLSRPSSRQMRFSDVVRELDLTQATAHAILKTLTDRGWVSRDPVAKTFALGPSLSLIAAGLDAARPLAHIARASAGRLAATIDMPASVIERAGDDLVITAFEQPKDSLIAPPNERISYTPPFGVAFAAWDTAAGQEAWVQRAAADDPALGKRLYGVLTETRARGFDVDWMTPALAQAAQVLGTLSNDGLPHSMRSIIDRLRVEMSSAGMPADDATASARSIATISAPVLDSVGRTQLVLAIHPVRPMTIRRIQVAARQLLQEVQRISDVVRGDAS